MWSSLGVGHTDVIIDMGNDIQTVVASTLAGHPFFKSNYNGAITIAKGAILHAEPIVMKRPNFALNGKGWIEAQFGKCADELIVDLKKANDLGLIDDDIEKVLSAVEDLKKMETLATLASINWADDYHEAMQSMGLEERSLKSLRIYGKVRKTSLIRACNQWQTADNILKTLDEFRDVWGEEETHAWKEAMLQKQEAKQIWDNTLHQFDTLSKKQKTWLTDAHEELQKAGPLSARNITERLIDNGDKRVNVNRIAKLLTMHGEDVGIIKSYRKSEYMALGEDSIFIKNIWPYAASLVDETGIFKISDRGESSLTLVTKGDRGKLHCNQLHNQIGFGRLQLDNRISKSELLEHRLEFIDDDITKLLIGCLPYIEDKSEIAKAMSLYILGEDDGQVIKKSMEEL